MADKGGKSIWEVLFNVGGKADPSLKKTFADARKGIDELKKSSNQLGTDFKSFVGNASKLALGIAGGVTAATAGIITMATSVAEVGDKAAKTAGAIGIGMEAYQELQYAMQQSGLEATEFDGALTKFSNTIKQAAAGSESMKKALDNVGLSAEELNKVPLEQAFADISNYMNSLPSDADRSAVAITLFGKTAGPKLMAAMKGGSAGIKELAQEARNFGIVMTDESARQSEEYLDNIMRMKTAASGLKTQFISGAIGPLTEAFGYLKDAVSDNMPAVQDLGAKFGKWIGETVKKIPEIITKVKDFGKWVIDGVNKVKDFAGGWKNVAKIAGGIAVAPTFISGLKTVFSLGKTVVAAFKTIGPILSGLKLVAAKSLGGIIVSAAPVIAVVAGIAAAAYLIIKNWDKVKPVVLGVFNKIKDTASTVITAMKSWWDEHGEKVTGVIDKIGEFIGTAFTKIQETIGVVIDQISAWWDENGEEVIAVMENIADFLQGALTAAWDVLSGAIDIASSAISGVIGFISDCVTWLKEHESVLGVVAIAIGALATAIGAYNVVQAIANAGGITAVAQMGAQAIATGVLSAATGVWSTVAGIASAATTAFGAAVAFLTSPITIVILAIGALIAIVYLIIKNWETVKEFFINLWNKIKEVFAGIGAWFSEKFTAAKEAVTGAFTTVGEFFTGIWNGIKEGFASVGEFFQGILDNIIEFLQPFIDAFKEIFGGVIDFFKGIFTGDFEGAWDGIKRIFGGVKDYFKAIIDKIIEFFQPLLDVFGKIGDFVGGALGKVGDFIGGAAGKVGNFFGGLFGGGKNKGVPGHADGGIFAHRHIAEIAEKGSEAVIPLNNTERGRKIWEQAGRIGGYAKSTSEKTSPPQVNSPSIIERTVSNRMSGGDSIVIHFNQNNTFSGTPDSQTIQQIEEAGRSGAKDLESQLNELLHNRRRVSYAAYTKG